MEHLLTKWWINIINHKFVFKYDKTIILNSKRGIINWIKV